MIQVLPIYIAGPVDYFQTLIRSQNPIIDLGEHFIKQTYRNRYEIAGPNGIERLIIPLEKGKNQKMAMHEVKISYAENWVNQHKKAIQTAYGNTPYYEYYGPEINSILEKRPEYLVDLSLELLNWSLEELGFREKAKEISKTYIEKGEDVEDFRMSIPSYEKIKFTHIHAQRYDLERDLSILDILFHEGRAARLRFL